MAARSRWRGRSAPRARRGGRGRTSCRWRRIAGSPSRPRPCRSIYGGFRFNLVDTPGHSDFSEDTYRTLTAVDAAVMVIDGAKGVESQTQKLFEVCRLRDLPILTFCNKMDRESRETFEIIDEIQENLAIDVTPASPGPSGMGRDFIGCLRHAGNDRLDLMDRADRNKVAERRNIEGLDDPKIAEHMCPRSLLVAAPRRGGDGPRAVCRPSTGRRCSRAH